MVDINLYDDEMEDNDKDEGPTEEQEDQSFDNIDDGGGLDLGEDLGGSDLESGEDFEGGFGGEDLSAESLDDALGFDEDLPGDDLDDESLMGEDLSDLDEGEAGFDDDDYVLGGGQRRKVSPLLWLFMLIVVVAAAIYIFRPELFSLPGSLTKKSVTKTSGKATQPRGERAGSQSRPTQAGQPGVAVTDSAAASGAQPGSISSAPVSLCLLASTKIFNDLTAQGQFAMLMVDKDRFTVEYASNSKGVSETFGQRLKNLAGADSYIASPEDMHTINGQPVYFGVISGKIPSEKPGRATGSSFATESAFINAIKTKIQQQGLKEIGQKKRSSQPLGMQQQVNYEWILEGDRTKVLSFLQSLNTLQGNWEPVKIRISPAVLNDFKAQKAKLVLDLMATIGKTQTPASKPVM
ncbi:hypothetical protein JW835_09990 [bacterium]|nr:hypothetical protein [bacterium]